MATRTEVAIILTALEEVYTNQQKLSDGAIMLYHEALKDIDNDVLKVAMLDWQASSEWFPKPSQLRDLALSYSHPKLITAMEAWGEVVEQMRKVGSAGKPQFSNPAIQSVVKAMGWRTLCLSESPDYDRAHFIKAYDQIASRISREVRTIPEVKALADKLSVSNLLDKGDSI